jgi:RNA polymerase sigma-70 factor (ECF subfamily)
VQIDPNLVALAKKGDDSAFEELYSLVYKDLYRSAYFCLSNRDDAEDVVSETFFQAYKGLHNLRDDSLFCAWIFKILHILCKKKKAEYVVSKNIDPIDDLPYELCDSHDEGDIIDRAALSNALKSLSESERMAVVLHSYLGYNGAEIAKILGCPHGTVNSKISRAHKKLREILE